MTVRDVFLTHGRAYLNAFGHRMPANHKKVIQAIIQCRTPDLGTIVCACEDCANTYRIFRSCGNRHCPTCQGEKAINWFNARIDRMLPVHHFMITCTVPAEFRDFFRSHQRFAYSALFQATSKAMTTLAAEPTYFAGDTPGFFGVLHTWGRQMQYHPHIHYVVPGGAFSSSDHSWHSCPDAFYLPVRVMSAKIKSHFFKLMQKADLLHFAPADAWKKNTECQLSSRRKWRTFHPVFIIIRLPYRHLKSSCHHHGEPAGTLPVHRYQKRENQDHEPFGI